jgi:glycerophosphoryl diester phosphodiesterase
MKNSIRHIRLFLFLLLMACSGSDPSGNIDRILEEFHDASSDYLLVAAHRAAHADGYPENSISAVKHAIDLGADIVELDVRITRDSVAVLILYGQIK